MISKNMNCYIKKIENLKLMFNLIQSNKISMEMDWVVLNSTGNI